MNLILDKASIFCIEYPSKLHCEQITRLLMTEVIIMMEHFHTHMNAVTLSNAAI